MEYVFLLRRFSVFMGGFCTILCAVILLGTAAQAQQDSVEDILKHIERQGVAPTDIDEPAEEKPREQGSADPHAEVREGKSLNLDDEEYPQSYLIEAQKFQRHCEGRASMRDYYDCACLAGEYLQRRKARGPLVHGTAIIAEISRTCADPTGAAGTVYSQCIGRDKTVSEIAPIESYCTCVANTYANLYKEGKFKPSSKTMVNLQTAAKMRCRNTSSARMLLKTQTSQR